MHANPKLTKVIAGRTISGSNQAEDSLNVTFDDGSTMKVKTAASNSNSAATGGKVVKVRQEGTDLSLDLADGKSLMIQTAEATSSILLRDKNGKMEYAD